MKKADKIKLWVFALLICGAFAVLTVSLADLQIRGADDYGAAAESMMTKTIYERGSRGQILDVNGALLGYDKKIYNIQFYREPSSKRAQNGAYSKAIWEVIQRATRFSSTFTSSPTRTARGISIPTPPAKPSPPRARKCSAPIFM